MNDEKLSKPLNLTVGRFKEVLESFKKYAHDHFGNHEKLSNILGGDDTGHYHLTKNQYDKIVELIGEE